MAAAHAAAALRAIGRGGWGAAGPRFAGTARRAAATQAAAPDVEAVVIGAGVVGLAIARQLACEAGKEVLVLEAGGGIGMETSSRNSEVIHAGIYYSPGSLKARLCVEGKQELYAFCAAHDIGHARLGKLLVATSAAQMSALAALEAAAVANGAGGLRQLSAKEVREMEPEVRCVAGLLSPSTGIIDSHGLMVELLRQAEEAGAALALRSRVVGGRLGATPGGAHSLTVQDAVTGEKTFLSCRLLVNAAGLHAQAVAASLAGLPPAAIPAQWLAKGSYYSLSGGRKAPFRHLVYPMPEPGAAGLGVHLTLDLAGQARFGPDVEWLPQGTEPSALDYGVDPERTPAFEAAIRTYYPALPEGALVPAYAGVRPKLSGPGAPAADFCVAGPTVHGVPGHVALYGIESPGLTACLALARHAAAELLGS